MHTGPVTSQRARVLEGLAAILLVVMLAGCGSGVPQERTATEGTISIAAVRGPDTEAAYVQTDRLSTGDVDVSSTPPTTTIEFDGELTRTTDGTIDWLIHLAELEDAAPDVIAELEALLEGGPHLSVGDDEVLYLSRPDLLAMSIGSDPKPWAATTGVVYLDQLDGRGIPVWEALKRLETTVTGTGGDPLSLLVTMGASLEPQGADGELTRYTACGPAIDATTWFVEAVDPDGDNGEFLELMEGLVSGEFCSTVWLDTQMRVTRIRQTVDWSEIFSVPIDEPGFEQPMHTEITWEYREVAIELPEGPFEDFTDMFARVLRNAG